MNNKETHYIEQYIQNLVSSCDHIARFENSYFLYDQAFTGQTIPILSGGGSGHEPAHLGFIGQGMLTGAIAGPIFAPPTSTEILTAIRFLNRGKGVFLIVKNFDADLRTFHSAMEQAKAEGIEVRSVISHDDISVETAVFKRRHRGVAGTIFLHKILGQAAQNGASLEDLEQLGLALTTHIATLSVATKPTSDFLLGDPMFPLQEGFISYGVGIHGEGGYRTVPFISLEKLAIELLNKLKMFYRWKAGDHFALLVNNLGQTPLSDETDFLGYLLDLLELEDIHVDFATHGTFMTSLDMAGLSVSLCKLTDPTWQDLLAARTTAPAWR